MSGSSPLDTARALPLQTVSWQPCHRLIAARFPTVGLYDQIASPDDLEVVFAIDALTNPRVRQELQQLNLIAPADRVTGPGATLVMAAFTHLNPLGSRFSDGSAGVYYAAESLDTAVAEVSHHRAAFLARTAEQPIDIDLRWVQADLSAQLHDLGGQGSRWPAVYDPNHYGAGQNLARALRTLGSVGIVYDSVRRGHGHGHGHGQGQGQCVAVFKPKALSQARAVGYIGLHWDGKHISHWYEKGAPRAL